MQIWVVILNYINLNADFIGYFKLHLITSILDKKNMELFCIIFHNSKDGCRCKRDSFKLSFIMTLVDKYREFYLIYFHNVEVHIFL